MLAPWFPGAPPKNKMRLSLILCFSSVLFAQSGNRAQYGSYQSWLLASFEADQNTSIAVGTMRAYFSPDLMGFYMPSQWNVAPTFPAYNCLGNVRDPSIIKSSVAVSNTYYLAHTVTNGGACAPNTHSIGLASGTDG